MSARRRGVSVVELVVFLALAAMVMALGWRLLFGALRRGARSEARLQGVDAVGLLAHALELDLSALHEGPGVAGPEVGGPDGSTLVLRVH